MTRTTDLPIGDRPTMACRDEQHQYCLGLIYLQGGPGRSEPDEICPCKCHGAAS